MVTGSAGQKIALFGNFGKGNLGNDATLQAMVHNLRKHFPQAQISCICPNPNGTELTYGIKAFPTRASLRTLFSGLRQHDLTEERSGASTTGVHPRNRGLSPIALLKAAVLEPYRWLMGLATLWGKDALIVPGTGLLTDAYGLLDWGPYEMFRWSITAKLCRCKLLFVSVGAGPLYTRAGRFFVKTALWLADFRSYRDESSKQCLEGIRFRTRNDPVYPDLVFSLPESVIPRKQESEARPLVVGLGLMEYAGKYSVEKPTSAVYAKYLETFLTFAKWLLAHDCKVRILIGDLADTQVTREFRAMLREQLQMHGDDRIIEAPVASVDDLLSQLAATDFVVATRFHNVLLSLLLNKPVISISFHHKCSSLMSQVGLNEYCQDINHLQPTNLIEQFCRLRQNADLVRRKIRERVKACQSALDEQYGTILSELDPESQPVKTRATEIRPGARDSVGGAGI
jgi:polysaccharide pyruvyl transferase WcaK-like protein